MLTMSVKHQLELNSYTISVAYERVVFARRRLRHQRQSMLVELDIVIITIRIVMYYCFCSGLFHGARLAGWKETGSTMS